MRIACVAVAVAVWATLAPAEEAAEVPVETTELGDSIVTLHLYPFLTEEEVTLLRLVASNDQALALLVPEAGGHAALAVSPDEGLLRDGAPVPSAIAAGQLPDAAAAQARGIELCNAARERQRKRDPECLVVLEVGPKPE